LVEEVWAGWWRCALSVDCVVVPTPRRSHRRRCLRRRVQTPRRLITCGRSISACLRKREEVLFRKQHSKWCAGPRTETEPVRPQPKDAALERRCGRNAPVGGGFCHRCENTLAQERGRVAETGTFATREDVPPPPRPRRCRQPLRWRDQRVCLRVGKSDIAGRGLIATKPLSKGTRVMFEGTQVESAVRPHFLAPQLGTTGKGRKRVRR
jgi:hypothetical protein